MLNRIRNSKIDLMEGFKVTDLLFEGGNVCGVKGHDEVKTRFDFKAKVVIDAGGRNSISLRRLNLRQASSGKRKVALAAHWEGVKVEGPYCYMHISHPGYTGIAPVGCNRANVVLVVDRDCLTGTNVELFFRRIVLENHLRRKILGAGAPAEKVRVTDSLAYSVKKPKCGGLLLVGDATGFIDPFTGEGIYLSLRSSQLAVGVIESAFDRSDFSKKQFQIYERMRRKEFKKKNMLSKVLQRLIYSPSLCDRVVETLATQKELSSLLIGVIGDYIPANRVVCFEYLLRLLGGMLKPQPQYLHTNQDLPNSSILNERKIS
jgi:flavin-dependent dehydrogenase